jgi:hypothetical protein
VVRCPSANVLIALLGIVALGIIPQLSIPPGALVAGGDGMNPELAPLVAWHHLAATWYASAGLGIDGSSVRPALFPFVLADLALRGAGVSPEAICRMWYALLFILQGTGSALLVSTLLGPRLPRAYLLVIGLFAAVNPYALISLHGPYLTTQLGLAAIPLLIATAIRYVRSRRFGDFILCLLVMALASTGDANPSVFLSEAALLFGVALLWASRACAAQIALLTLAFLSINAIWILPSYLALEHALPFLGPASSQYSDATLRVVSQFSGWPHSLRLIGEYLFFNPVAGAPYLPEGAAYDSNPALLVSSWAVPLCALVGLVAGARAREWDIVKVGAIAAVALFLAKGSAPPLGELFDFLSAHFTVFRGFRDSFAKFEWIVVLAYAILLARCFVAAQAQLRGQARDVFAGAVAGFVTGAIVVAGYPILVGHLFWPHVIVRIPQRYAALATLLNGQRTDAAAVEMPIAPYVFDAYRWGYIGAGINAQMLERPVLSGAFRLLSPVNESVAGVLEHVDQIGDGALAPWLGLYGFGSIISDDAVRPEIFTPGEPGSALPRALAGARVAWESSGLHLLAIDDGLVNPRLFVAQTLIGGTSSEGDAGLVCRALRSCRSVAFVAGDVRVPGRQERASLVRRSFYSRVTLTIPTAGRKVRVFVDDAVQTRDVTGDPSPITYETSFPSRPAVLRIATDARAALRPDAVVDNALADVEPVRFCRVAGQSAQVDLTPDAEGPGVMALTYGSDRDAGAHLLIESKEAGASETRLEDGVERASIVRRLQLDGSVRARILLEARPTPACIELTYFAFATLRPQSPYFRALLPRRGTATPYQLLHPDPLAAYDSVTPPTIDFRCTSGCAARAESESRLRDVPLRALAAQASPDEDMRASGKAVCAAGPSVRFRGEGLRLSPGLRYDVSLTAQSSAAASIRFGILSEDEYAIATSAFGTAGGVPGSSRLTFIAPAGIPNAVLFVAVDGPESNKACVLSATVRETAPQRSIELGFVRQAPADATLEPGDAGTAYRLNVRGLDGTPRLIVLEQTFDDRWRLESAPQLAARHIAVNGGVNGWIVNGRGDAKIAIRFSGSSAAQASLAGGGLGLGVALLLAFALARKRLA